MNSDSQGPVDTGLTESQRKTTSEKAKSIWGKTGEPFTKFFLENTDLLAPDGNDGGTARTAGKIARNSLFKPLNWALDVATIAEADNPQRQAAKVGTSIASGILIGGAIVTSPVTIPAAIVGIATGVVISELSDFLFDKFVPQDITIQDVKANAQEFVDGLQEFWQDKIVDTFDSIKEGLLDSVESLLDTAGEATQDLLDAAKEIKDTTFEKVQEYYEKVKDSFQDWVDGIGEPLPLGFPDPPPPPPDPDNNDDGSGPPPPPDDDVPNPPPPTWPPSGGGNPFFFPLISPLVIDVDNDGIELISLANSDTQFDLDSDGFSELTGWVQPDDALLAYDINGNGYIDDISELFGNATTDGFTELAEIDNDKNGTIDINDSKFENLVLWHDLNTNGISEVGELTSALSAGLSSIQLDAKEVYRTNAGHKITHVSSTQWIGGLNRSIEDVWFENNQMFSSIILPSSFQLSKEALSLPSLTGYGDVPDLSYSLTTREDLAKSTHELLDTIARGSLSLFIGEFEKFLWDWTDVKNVSSTEGGKHIDGRHLAFLESLYGQSFYSLHQSTPSVRTSEVLEAQYQAAVSSMASRFLIQALSNGNLSIEEGHAKHGGVAFLGSNLISFDTDNNRLIGNVSSIVDSIVSKTEKGSVDSISIAEGALLLRLLQSDFGPDPQSYKQEILTALQKSSLEQDIIEIIQKVVFQDYPIYGTSGSETLTGTNIGEIFDGGKGDDVLDGSFGSDTYLWGTGTGSDIIDERGYRFEKDTVLLTNLNSDDVTFSRSLADGLDLVISVNSTGETLTVDEHFKGSTWGIEKVIFADGSVWDNNKILTEAWYRGTNGNDTITGLSSATDEIFDGGKGDDVLDGSFGSDTYLWGTGTGSDIIDERGYRFEKDTVLLTNLNSDDVTFSRSLADGLDLVISVNSTGETLTVDEHFKGSTWGIEKVIFADGSVWDNNKILTEAWYRGTNGNDTITGLSSATDEIFDGGKGDDVLDGSFGSDTYLWGTGTGSDIIDERGYRFEKDTVLLTNLNSDDVTFSRSLADGLDLVISINSTGETLTVDEHFKGSTWGIEKVIFADGSVWDNNKILTEAWYRGTNGNDTITGLSSATDEIFDGGKGDDVLISGSKYDKDVMVFRDSFGHDLITDFIAGKSYGDVIRIDGTSVSTFSQILGQAEQVGQDTLITLAEDSSIRLQGVDRTRLHADNFDFL